MEVKPLDQYRFAKVLVCVSHFDDEALFCGGTLRKLRDQGCQLGIAVASRVEETNAPRDPGQDDRARQQRRLVAFGRACGMLDVERTWLLDCQNAKQVPNVDIYQAIFNGLLPVLGEFAPDVVLTHGRDGEYGHPQHKLVHAAAWAASTTYCPVWFFSADGPLVVPIDLEWKKRLTRCYRHGTTQDVGWAPYCRNLDSPLEPWLGDVERFEAVQ